MSSRRAILVLLLLAGCEQPSRTAFRLTVGFDANAGIDQLRVQLAAQGLDVVGPRTVPEPPALLDPGLHLVLLVPDDWVGTTVEITVAGLAAGKEVARAKVSAEVRRDAVVDLEVTLTTACSDSCTPGKSECLQDQVRRCVSDGGCARFTAPEACPAERPFCLNGGCNATCTDECPTVGARRCVDKGYQVCSERPTNRCRYWSQVFSCGPTEVCRAGDGQCVAACGGQPCPCQAGEIVACKDVGECRGGVRTCVNGQFDPCAWQVGPQPEVCDGKDNDCNGTADDNLAPPGCDKQVGACQGATKKCGGAAGWLACTDADYAAQAQSKGLVHEAVETRCDGQDNDCNGKTDEPASCCQPRCAGKPCGASDGCTGTCSGSCGAGQRCVGGACLCDPISCAGCCSGQQCLGGASSSACGSGGEGCKLCGSGSTCSAGVCKAPTKTIRCAGSAAIGLNVACSNVCSVHGQSCVAGCFSDPLWVGITTDDVACKYYGVTVRTSCSQTVYVDNFVNLACCCQ